MENRYLKKFGQNFLINENIADKIVNQIKNTNIKVLEIGPGDGVLTKRLQNLNISLSVCEIDEFYISKLKETYPNLNIIEKNILKIDINDFDYIIGNIPYNITSEILLKLVTTTKQNVKITLMIQKEAFQRIIESKSTSEITSLSTLIKTRYKYHKVVEVSRKNFNPMPNVDSTVFNLEENKLYEIKNYRDYYEFLLILFNSKRKTIYNNLVKKYNKDILLSTINNLNLKQNYRIEELKLEDIINLYNSLKEEK